MGVLADILGEPAVGQTVDGGWVLGRYRIHPWSRAATAAALADGRQRPRVCQWLLCSLNLLRTLAGDRYTRGGQCYRAART